MSFSGADHLTARFTRAPVAVRPFPHFYMRNVFPADLYAQLLAELPSDDRYAPTNYPSRFFCGGPALDGTVWQGLSDWMCEHLTGIVIDRFRPQFVERFKGKMAGIIPDVRLIRDRDGYEIKPHTDNPAKLASLLFYLPTDDALADLGTVIYRPRAKDFRCEGTKRWDFAGFKEVWRAPFVANACLGFFKSDVAFHGVPAIDRPGLERNVLLFNLYDANHPGGFKMAEAA